jgi:hypothetical protein
VKSIQDVETVPPAWRATVVVGAVRAKSEPAVTLRTGVQPGAAGGYEQTIAEINRLQDVSADWDSYGGGPVGKAARDRALAFIGTLLESAIPVPPPPQVGPSMDEGVMLRWKLPGRDLAIVFLDDRAEFSIIDRASDEVIAEGIARDISRFIDEHFTRNVGP